METEGAEKKARERKECQERLEKKRAEKKEQKERLEEQRTERNEALQMREITVTGTDIRNMTEKMVGAVSKLKGPLSLK